MTTSRFCEDILTLQKVARGAEDVTTMSWSPDSPLTEPVAKVPWILSIYNEFSADMPVWHGQCFIPVPFAGLVREVPLSWPVPFGSVVILNRFRSFAYGFFSLDWTRYE